MRLLICIPILVCAWCVQVIKGSYVVSQIRLVGGNSSGTGRLQLLLDDGKWVTALREDMVHVFFNYLDARVVCRMLGYDESGIPYIFNQVGDLFGPGYGPQIYHVFNCNGTEASLAFCGFGYESWTFQKYYDHTHDVGFSCERIKVRLADGDSPQSGRVEVYFKGKWSAVCHSGFGNKEARVICNMLGYIDTGIAQPFANSQFGQGSDEIMISRLSCTGTETDIKYCAITWKQNSCDHRQEAGVNCGSTPIRLVNGPNNSSGRVEIYHSGQWGTICGSYFDVYDATVICKMLGIYTPGAFGYADAFYGEGTGTIITKNLDCDGTESDIAQCNSLPWTVSSTYSSCGHTNDAGVNCAGKTVMRLVDGSSKQSGRVEIYRNGHWGTLSGDGFNDHDLAVVCRTLGYEYNNSRSFYVTGSYYGTGIGEVVVSKLQCNGAENDIGQCQGWWWPGTTQNHATDVGVNCDGTIQIRLAGGESNSTGRVEIYHDGNYGTVCNRLFDRPDLIVVCRMLGFENITHSAYWHTASSYSQGLGEIGMSDLTCNGNELNLGQCGGYWPGDRSCDHSNDVFVNCDGGPEKIRLVNGPSNYSGRVEFFHSGQWGTICDDDFDRADAVVICRVLNFPNPEKAVAYSLAHYGPANDTVPIFISQLNCNGLEKNLGQCYPNWSPTCTHPEDSGVDCCRECDSDAVEESNFTVNNSSDNIRIKYFCKLPDFRSDCRVKDKDVFGFWSLFREC